MKCGVILSSRMRNWRTFNRKSEQYFENGLQGHKTDTANQECLEEASTVLRITVEIVPHGLEIEKKTLGVMTIANLGTRSDDTADYGIDLTTDQGREAFILRDFDRGRGWLPLVRDAFRKMMSSKRARMITRDT